MFKETTAQLVFNIQTMNTEPEPSTLAMDACHSNPGAGGSRRAPWRPKGKEKSEMTWGGDVGRGTKRRTRSQTIKQVSRKPDQEAPWVLRKWADEAEDDGTIAGWGDEVGSCL